MEDLNDYEKRLSKSNEFINIIKRINNIIDDDLVKLTKSSWVYEPELMNKITAYSSFGEILKDTINKIQR